MEVTVKGGVGDFVIYCFDQRERERERLCSLFHILLKYKLFSLVFGCLNLYFVM